MSLEWLFLIVAFILLFGGMIYYVQHLKKLGKEEQDDFEHARTDTYLAEPDSVKDNTKRKKNGIHSVGCCSCRLLRV